MVTPLPDPLPRGGRGRSFSFSSSASLAFISLVVATSGCRHSFPRPYPVAQLQADSANWPGDALVHYLTQPNADVAVCAVNESRAVQRLDDDLVNPFVTSLEDEALAPERWQACATKLVPSLDVTVREYFFGKLARLVLSLLSEEKGAPRLLAAHDVLAARPRETSQALETLLVKLHDFPRQKLPPTLPPVFDALVTTLDLDHGQLQGRALTADDITNTMDEALLLRMTTRLPDEGQRLTARRRLVQLRIARSDVKEVRERAADVEAAVVATGRWAQSTKGVKLARPEAPLPLPMQSLIKQDVEAQQVSLFAPGQAALEVAPTLDLRPSLRFSLVGWSQPLALCGAAAALLVEPCVDVKDVEVANPVAKLDADGVLRLPERLPMSAAFELARAGEGLVVPVRLDGQLVTTLHVPLTFLAPAAYFFEGERANRGPAVNVVVVPTEHALLFDAVDERNQRRQVIYPRNGGAGFELGSVGGKGWDGSRGRDGYDGSRGYNGNSASCPSMSGSSGGMGGRGGDGGPGGAGGQGGEGGPVYVELRCGGPCVADERLVRQLVHSRGGAGGDGGSGGRGGRGGEGGSGGSGTSCTVNGQTQYLSGGSSGSRGSDGSRGYDGPDGSQGMDGSVQVMVR